jgi:hypothetical protein
VEFNTQPGAARTRIKSPPPVQKVSITPNPTGVPHRPSAFGSVSGAGLGMGDQIDNFDAGLHAAFDFQFDVDAPLRFRDI